jgi:hypothetical protein
MSDQDLPPGEANAVHSGWESELNTERAKTNVRWFAILILAATLEWIRLKDPTLHISNTVMFGLVGASVAMTGLEALTLWQPNRRTIPHWFKYVTVSGDMAFVSVLIYYTDFTQSPFFFVYFVFLISNCLRYGLLMSLFVALVFNVLYVIVLGLAPAEKVRPSVLGGEGLKIIAFWAVALYGGVISARLRRQANQLRVYEETIAELKARLKTFPETPPSGEAEP